MKDIHYLFNQVVEVLNCLPVYIMSHLVMHHYDKRYLQSDYFKGRLGGIKRVGWKWLYYDWKGCRALHVNLDTPWPVNPRATVYYPENIIFDPEDLNNFQSPGTYFQANGRIIIGKGTFIGPNVGLITSNHVITDLKKHEKPKEIIIGKKCWIGMNTVILPGVVLGDRTIVGAGSVVTKSFTDGNCIITGTPAKFVRKIFEEKETHDE